MMFSLKRKVCNGYSIIVNEDVDVEGHIDIACKVSNVDKADILLGFPVQCIFSFRNLQNYV